MVQLRWRHLGLGALFALIVVWILKVRILATVLLYLYKVKFLILIILANPLEEIIASVLFLKYGIPGLIVGILLSLASAVIVFKILEYVLVQPLLRKIRKRLPLP